MAKTVSIHSFRGGTGKSNLTANLSAIMALQGKRVGIVDTDILSPGIHVIFGMDEDDMKLALNDYLWGRCKISECAYEVTPDPVKEKGGKIFLIPSSIKAGEIARVLREGYDVGLLNEGFQSLIRNLKLDYLFIDTHPGLNEETLLSVAISDALVIIMRPDYQDYQGTAVTVDVARRLGVPKMLVVVNKAIASLDPEALRQQVIESYGAEVGGIFPLSEEMLQMASRGVFCLNYPDHIYSQKVRELSTLLFS